MVLILTHTAASEGVSVRHRGRLAIRCAPHHFPSTASPRQTTGVHQNRPHWPPIRCGPVLLFRDISLDEHLAPSSPGCLVVVFLCPGRRSALHLAPTLVRIRYWLDYYAGEVCCHRAGVGTIFHLEATKGTTKILAALNQLFTHFPNTKTATVAKWPVAILQYT